MISFILPIEPVAKGRPRFSKFGAYTPAATRRFENEVKMLAKRHAPIFPLEGPLHLKLCFMLRRPKRTKNLEPCVRPDLDNYVKGVMDGLNELFWKDDSQVVQLEASKQYTVADQPRILVTVTQLAASP